MFQADPGPGGGFVKSGDHGYKQGEVLIYISTDDIDATLAKVESLGGKTLQPKTEIPQTGWFATELRDSFFVISGNVAII